MGKYYLNNTGVVLVLDVGEDITQATDLAILVKKPDGTRDTWSAVEYTTTEISYIIQAGDWDQTGRYYIQSYVKTPSWEGVGEIAYFDIYDNFE